MNNLPATSRQARSGTETARWVSPKLSRVLVASLIVAMLTACSPIRLVNNLSPSGHYSVTENLVYGSDARHRVDVYVPRAVTQPAPLVVFFYGGGWREGDKDNYEFVASSLTQAGYVVMIPDYRLFPDVVFPQFVEDGAAAVAWATQNAQKFGADSNRFFLMGHSAGAHIAALLSMDKRYLGQHAVNRSALRGFVGLSGPYDFLPIDSGYLVDVFPENQRKASQPINFVSADAPATLLIHGTGDDVVRAANSQNLTRKLSDNGVDATLRLYQGTGHVRVAAALAPPLDFTGKTLEDTLTFLDRLSASEKVSRSAAQNLR